MAPRARPPASFSPVGVFTGSARPKGAAPRLLPPGCRLHGRCPALQVSRTRAGRPRSPADPASLVFLSAAIGHVSLSEEPEGGGTSELRNRAHRIREAPRQPSLADGI
ncbi:hypothetical protein NDU88_000015 [Pleurodeles waltl]|uniref:Uncharacterized protein n=1 Tax=Pleurodeles waltl TaxID=8319 RepID=A0AAV7S8E9_PLEWA|nr:hypothetical protein NDU88_000015 [Pleurodeles waltl]